MSSGQEQVLLNQIPVAYLNVLRQPSRDENLFPVARRTCCFIFDTPLPAKDGVKKAEHISILYHPVIFTHHDKYCLVIGAYSDKEIADIRFFEMRYFLQYCSGHRIGDR